MHDSHAPHSLPAFTDLPDSPGVYRFFGNQGELLYVGKSINIRQRVRSHFQASNPSPRARRMCGLTDQVDFTVTAGELGALLLENREIKERQPIFNRRQRRYRQLHTWVLNPAPNGFLVPGLFRRADNNPLWQQDCFGLYRSPRQAHQALEKWVKDAQLCPAICGLERHQGACFSWQLGRCRGACCGEETADQHNQRLLGTLLAHQIQAWPYRGTLVIRERSDDAEDYHLIRQWCHLTTLQQPPSPNDLSLPYSPCFDLDSYRMLVQFLNRGIEHFVMS